MEPIGVTASFIAIVTASIQSAKIVHEVVSGIRNGPTSVTQLKTATKDLQDTLIRIDAIAQTRQPINRHDDFAALKKALTTCKDDLQALEGELRKLSPTLGDRWHQSAWKKAQRVLSVDDFSRMWRKILYHYSVLNNCLTIEGVNMSILHATDFEQIQNTLSSSGNYNTGRFDNLSADTAGLLAHTSANTHTMNTIEGTVGRLRTDTYDHYAHIGSSLGTVMGQLDTFSGGLQKIENSFGRQDDILNRQTTLHNRGYEATVELQRRQGLGFGSITSTLNQQTDLLDMTYAGLQDMKESQAPTKTLFEQQSQLIDGTLRQQTDLLDMNNAGIQAVQHSLKQQTHRAERASSGVKHIQAQQTLEFPRIAARSDEILQHSQTQNRVLGEHTIKMDEALSRLDQLEGLVSGLPQRFQKNSASKEQVEEVKDLLQAFERSNGVSQQRKIQELDDDDRPLPESEESQESLILQSITNLCRLAEQKDKTLFSEEAELVIRDLKQLLFLFTISPHAENDQTKRKRSSSSDEELSSRSRCGMVIQREAKRSKRWLDVCESIAVNRNESFHDTVRPKVYVATHNTDNKRIVFSAKSWSTMTPNGEKMVSEASIMAMKNHNSRVPGWVIQACVQRILIANCNAITIQSNIEYCPILPNDSKVFQCIQDDDIQALKQMLEEGSASLHDCDEVGNTLLTYASYHCSTAATRFLLEKGADPNFVSVSLGWDPEAAQGPTSKPLLDYDGHGCNACKSAGNLTEGGSCSVILDNSCPETLDHQAHRSLVCKDLLLEAGADPELQVIDQRSGQAKYTPLYVILGMFNVDALQRVLKHNDHLVKSINKPIFDMSLYKHFNEAPFEQPPGEALTMLHAAVLQPFTTYDSSKHMWDLLRQYGAEISVRTRAGDTVLHCWANHVKHMHSYTTANEDAIRHFFYRCLSHEEREEFENNDLEDVEKDYWACNIYEYEDIYDCPDPDYILTRGCLVALIEAGADVKAFNREGKTPGQIAWEADLALVNQRAYKRARDAAIDKYTSSGGSIYWPMLDKIDDWHYATALTWEAALAECGYDIMDIDPEYSVGRIREREAAEAIAKRMKVDALLN